MWFSITFPSCNRHNCPLQGQRTKGPTLTVNNVRMIRSKLGYSTFWGTQKGRLQVGKSTFETAPSRVRSLFQNKLPSHRIVIAVAEA